MSKKKYSDADIQAYLDGNFSGDVEDLREFIKRNPAAANSLELYRHLFQEFQRPESPDLPRNLPDSVIAAIMAKKAAWKQSRQKPVEIALAVIAIVSLCAATIKAAVGLAAISNYALTGVFATGIILFLWMFTKIELYAKQKIYS